MRAIYLIQFYLLIFKMPKDNATKSNRLNKFNFKCNQQLLFFSKHVQDNGFCRYLPYNILNTMTQLSLSKTGQCPRAQGGAWGP